MCNYGRECKTSHRNTSNPLKPSRVNFEQNTNAVHFARAAHLKQHIILIFTKQSSNKAPKWASYTVDQILKYLINAISHHSLLLLVNFQIFATVELRIPLFLDMMFNA